MICKICNKNYKYLGKHIRIHNIPVEKYYLDYIRNKGKCKICNKSTRFATLDIGYHSFCSKKCYDVYQANKTYRNKEYIKKICRGCGIEYEVIPSDNSSYHSRQCYLDNRDCNGINNPFYGKKHTLETIKKISGKNSNNWKGGKSFESYGIEFNNQLRNQIRKRYKFTCQECGMTEKELEYKLSIHHIDYNKHNNLLSNLITLCKSCHSKTNFNRNDWEGYYKSKVM